MKAAKAPAKRAPRRTALAPAAARAPGERTITFHGRMMAVVLPSAEQLTVWKRTGARFGDLADRYKVVEEKGAGATPEEHADLRQATADLLDRALSVLQSVLPDQADRYWLEDQLLSRTLDFSAALELMPAAMAAFGGRATAPTTGPVRARRRA